MSSASTTPRWALLVPLAGGACLAAGFFLHLSGPFIALMVAVLMGAVIAAVHHAEVIAERVGEPFGTLVLALAVTVIEASLIVSLTLTGGPQAEDLARDTLFSAVMIVCNGVVGLCLLVGGIRHGEQEFRIESASSSLGVLVALATLTLVIPVYTTSSPGPTFSVPQLIFAGVASLVLYASFVFVQTVRHREYFLAPGAATETAAHERPPLATAVTSAVLLLVCLVSVVGLAKLLSPGIEAAVISSGAPEATVGIAIAFLVLLPEALAAVRSAYANRLQLSLNLALGSALASIGLTIPAVVAVSVLMGIPLTLGLGAKDTVLLALTFVVSTLTFFTGRTTVLQGAVHLVIFAAFLFLSLVP